MLAAADIDRAAETLRATAAIRFLRGGVVTFDENLRPQDWREADDEMPTVWVLVPDDAAGLAECRSKAVPRSRGRLTKLGAASWR